jgi:hypothetical protein
MQEFFASYLVQKKECSIPLIGKFHIHTKPAELDVANKQLSPPFDEILFDENAGYLPEEITSYISARQNISQAEAEEKIHHWCLHTKSKLDAGEEIVFDSVGSLHKNADGAIIFKRKIGFQFYENILAERVVHKDAEHAVLVGDMETTSGAMNEYFRETAPVKKATWKLWAIILFALSLIILAIYFYDHKFSTTSVGNQNSLPMRDAPASYSEPK